MTEPLTQEFDLTKLLSGPYYCVGCAGRVCRDIAALSGVVDSACDVEAGTLTVTYRPRELHARDLETAVRRLALEATDSVGHAAYRLTGLD